MDQHDHLVALRKQLQRRKRKRILPYNYKLKAAQWYKAVSLFSHTQFNFANIYLQFL
jgi:hypothetical protein